MGKTNVPPFMIIFDISEIGCLLNTTGNFWENSRQARGMTFCKNINLVQIHAPQGGVIKNVWKLFGANGIKIVLGKFLSNFYIF